MSDSYPLPTEPEGIVAPLLDDFIPVRSARQWPCTTQSPYSSRMTGEPSLITPKSPPDSSAISGSVYRRRPRRDMCRWRRYRPDRAGLVN